MDLYFVIYSSIPTRKLEPLEVADLLNVARTANKVHSITGILLLLNGEYIQLIEGKKQYIDQLYKNICADSRHKYLIMLYEGYIIKRHFQDWSMAFDKLEFPFCEDKDTFDLENPRSKRLMSIIGRF